MIYGQKSSFSASDANLRINIEDAITRYPDYKFPILKRLNSSVFDAEVLSYRYDWSEQDLRPVKSLPAAAKTATDTTLTLKTAGVFKQNDVMLNKRTKEKMLIIADFGAGTQVTAVRGFGGTTAGTIIDTDELVRMGTAAPEGAKSTQGSTPDTGDMYNFTSILRDYVEMSDGQYKGFIRGDETKAKGIERVQQELMEGLAMQLLVGTRWRDASQKRSTLGGVQYFVDNYASQNKVDFGGAATWNNDLSVINKLEDAIQKIAEKMGNKPTVYASYGALRKVRLVQDDALQSTRGDNKRGIGVVTQLQSGMGDLDVVQVIDRAGIMDDFIFLIDETKVGYKARKGRGWFIEEKPFDGDGHKWQVLGEYTMKVETPANAVAYLTNLGVAQ